MVLYFDRDLYQSTQVPKSLPQNCLTTTCELSRYVDSQPDIYIPLVRLFLACQGMDLKEDKVGFGRSSGPPSVSRPGRYWFRVTCL